MNNLLSAIIRSLKLIFSSVRMFCGAVVCCTVYFIPFGFALMRNSNNKLSIFLLNLLLGWTLVGWVFALVWAARKRTDAV